MSNPLTPERIGEILDDSVDKLLESMDTMETLDDVKLTVGVLISRVRVCAELLRHETESDDYD